MDIGILLENDFKSTLVEKKYEGVIYLHEQIFYNTSEIDYKKISSGYTNLELIQNLTQRSNGQKKHPIIIKCYLKNDNLLLWNEKAKNKFNIDTPSKSKYSNLKLDDNKSHEIFRIFNGVIFKEKDDSVSIHSINSNIKIMGYSIDEGNNEWTDFISEDELNKIIE